MLKSQVSGEKNIWEICQLGHIERLKQLIDEDNSLINKQDADERTPLHWSCANGNVECAILLLKNNADINTCDEMGWTPLMSATSSGHEKIVQLLIENDVDVNFVNHDNRSAIYYACKNKLHKIFDYLIDHGAKIDVIDNFGNNLLHRAAAYGNEFVVSKIVKKISPNIQNHNGDTSLHISAQGNFFSTVKILLENGAIDDIKNNDDCKPSDLTTDKRLLEFFDQRLKRNTSN